MFSSKVWKSANCILGIQMSYHSYLLEVSTTFKTASICSFYTLNLDCGAFWYNLQFSNALTVWPARQFVQYQIYFYLGLRAKLFYFAIIWSQYTRQTLSNHSRVGSTIVTQFNQRMITIGKKCSFSYKRLWDHTRFDALPPKSWWRVRMAWRVHYLIHHCGVWARIWDATSWGEPCIWTIEWLPQRVNTVDFVYGIVIIHLTNWKRSSGWMVSHILCGKIYPISLWATLDSRSPLRYYNEQTCCLVIIMMDARQCRMIKSEYDTESSRSDSEFDVWQYILRDEWNSLSCSRKGVLPDMEWNSVSIM